MKKIKLFGAAGLLIAAAYVASAFKNIKTNSDKGFAVVELFTSEGCSSCPSAEAVAEKLNKEMGDKPVYILAYHVDYWDRGGWRDVFSSKDYTKRQNDYANWFNLSSIYTPQVVVNGKNEFVGSQEGTLRNAIQSGLKGGSKASVELDHATENAGKVSVAYHATAGPNIDLVTALVQPYAQVKVKGGENGGRTLSHVRIVRQVQHQALNGSKEGNISLTLPKGTDTKNWEVVSFLQDTNTGEILGATQVALN